MDRLPKITGVVFRPSVTVALCVLTLFGIARVLGDYNKAKMSALDNLRPVSFDYLYAFAQNDETLDEKRLKEYAHYYTKAAEFMPERADAHAMAGFCYYHLGEVERAIFLYRRSAKLNPQFFWSYYNLGVIYFKEREYKQALESFKDALEAPPDATLKYMYSSRIYRTVLRCVKPGYAPDASIREAYHKIRAMHTIGTGYLQRPLARFEIPKQISSISPQIF